MSKLQVNFNKKLEQTSLHSEQLGVLKEIIHHFCKSVADIEEQKFELQTELRTAKMKYEFDVQLKLMDEDVLEKYDSIVNWNRLL